MRLKKIIALILSLFLTVGTLSSCSAFKLKKAIKNADQALTAGRFEVDASITFVASNAELRNMLTIYNDTGINIIVDGDKFLMHSETDTAAEGFSIKVDNEMIVADDTLYSIVTASYNGQRQTTTQKAPLNEEQKADFFGDAVASSDIESADFENLSLSRTKNGYTITCTEIKGDCKDSLIEIIEKELAQLDATAYVCDTFLILTLEGERYKEVLLICEYMTIIHGDEYPLTMYYKYRFNYDDVKKVLLPADGDSYTEVQYEDIIEK